MTDAMIVYNGFLHKDAPPQCVTRFFEAAKICGIDLFPVKNTELTELLLIPSEINGKNSKRRERIKTLLSSCSFIIFWDKDVFLCRILENIGLRVFNSSDAIRICDDKALTALRLSEKPRNFGGISEKTKNFNGISDENPTLSVKNLRLSDDNCSLSEKNETCFLNQSIKMPKTIIAPMTFQNIGYTDLSFLDNAVEILGFPMVVKERNGSLGEQVYLAKNYSELKNTVEQNGSNLLFQEFIDTSYSSRFFDCPAAFKSENLKNAERSDVDCIAANAYNAAENKDIKRRLNVDCTAANADNADRLKNIKSLSSVDCATKNKDIERLSKADCIAANIDKNKTNSSFDVRIYVVNGKTAGAILRKNPNDFRANIAKGSTAFPYSPTDEEKKIAEAAVAMTNLFFGGVDIIADKNGERYLLEVNSNAGFTGFEKATGIDVAQKIIDEIISNLSKNTE